MKPPTAMILCRICQRFICQNPIYVLTIYLRDSGYPATNIVKIGWKQVQSGKVCILNLLFYLLLTIDNTSFPSFGMSSIWVILARDISHFTCQYQPFYRTIRLILRANMADITNRRTICRCLPSLILQHDHSVRGPCGRWLSGCR